MTALRLVSPATSPPSAGGRARQAHPPVQPGDRVRVSHPVVCPSGRVLRRGTYAVVEVLWGPDLPPPLARPGWRLRIAGLSRAEQEAEGVRLDCSRLPKKPFQETGHLASQPSKVFLDAGQWTAYASGDGPETIPNHPGQN